MDRSAAAARAAVTSDGRVPTQTPARRWTLQPVAPRLARLWGSVEIGVRIDESTSSIDESTSSVDARYLVAPHPSPWCQMIDLRNPPRQGPLSAKWRPGVHDADRQETARWGASVPSALEAATV